MRILYLSLVFQVLLALMPIYVLSHDISLPQATNTTGNGNTSTEGSSGMSRRPLKILRRTQRPPVFLTAEPTNTKQVILFCRVGLFLQVDDNGTISSSLNQNSENVKFELQSFGTSILRILNIATGKYIAMDSKGMLQTRENATNECLFYQHHEENSYVSFASFKYYMKKFYDMFIGIKRNGEVRKGTTTLPGQDSNLFLPLNLGKWRNSRNDKF